MASLHRSVKHGLGRLTASADATATTRLTQVSHKAPTRLIPLPKSSVHKAGAAICALSNYGAGMLQGDTSEISVNVEKGAKLGITTQGTSRIYSQRNNLADDERVCRVVLNAKVENGGLCVVSPDPISLFSGSSFVQQQTLEIHPQSSVVLVDWFSSGRYRNGERWNFDYLKSTTSLHWLVNDGNSSGDTQIQSIPFLQDSVGMDYRIRTQDSDPFGVDKINSFASLILYGDQSSPVLRACETVQDKLTESHTRIRTRGPIHEKEQPSQTDGDLDHVLDSLSGRVCMGVSRVSLGDPQNSAHVVRLAATTNEDIYRIFHHCLLPLESSFGYQFYKDRIHATTSEISKADTEDDTTHIVATTKRKQRDKVQKLPTQTWSATQRHAGVGDDESSSFWSAYMLADSSMPTGSFAHSAGLEVAAQLGLIQNEGEVGDFIRVAIRSTMQTTTPFVVAGHRLGMSSIVAETNELSRDVFDFSEQFSRLDKQTQAIMGSNAPACAASLDQGKSLGRVVHQWLRDTDGESSSRQQQMLLSLQQGGHLGPMIGVVGAFLKLSEIQVVRLLGYCAARDMVSAAVRLSLVGPLASVRLLHQVQGAVQEGLDASLVAMQEQGCDPKGGDNAYVPLSAATTSSPVLEALHPCHDLLQVRLFRS